jgi:hypothetical protein
MQQIAFQVTNCMAHYHLIPPHKPRVQAVTLFYDLQVSPTQYPTPGTCCVLDSEQGDLADFRFQIPAHLVLPHPPKFRVLITPLQMR